MEEIADVPFCNGQIWNNDFFSLHYIGILLLIDLSSLDFANAEDNVVTCSKDDCCGMLKEYFIK